MSVNHSYSTWAKRYLPCVFWKKKLQMVQHSCKGLGKTQKNLTRPLSNHWLQFQQSITKNYTYSKPILALSSINLVAGNGFVSASANCLPVSIYFNFITFFSIFSLEKWYFISIFLNLLWLVGLLAMLIQPLLSS